MSSYRAPRLSVWVGDLHGYIAAVVTTITNSQRVVKVQLVTEDVRQVDGIRVVKVLQDSDINWSTSRILYDWVAIDVIPATGLQGCLPWELLGKALNSKWVSMSAPSNWNRQYSHCSAWEVLHNNY